MLSIRESVFTVLRLTILALAVAALGACAPRPAGNDGVAVDVNAPVRVALLLPYGTGDPGREQIARSLQNAAELARSELRDATIELVVYPTAGTSGGGASAAQQAVAEGASIIVGPLFSTATAGAQPVAAQAGLTVLSLSNNATVAGGNVYILGNTFFNTADRLVGYGMARGLRNYGVVYPRGLEGETARDAVAQAVSQNGANLVASEGYDLSFAGMQAAAAPAAAALRGNGANAVILTDGPTGGLGFIADGLRGNGLDPASAIFMGMQRWDASAEVLGQPSLQGGVFATADPSLSAAFEGRYANAYGERPHELASLGFDAVAAVGAMIAEARAGGGSPFSTQRITQPAGFAGASGPFRLFPNGMNQRSLAIMEVRGGQAVIVDPAARSFGGLGN